MLKKKNARAKAILGVCDAISLIGQNENNQSSPLVKSKAFHSFPSPEPIAPPFRRNTVDKQK